MSVPKHLHVVGVTYARMANGSFGYTVFGAGAYVSLGYGTLEAVRIKYCRRCNTSRLTIKTEQKQATSSCAL